MKSETFLHPVHAGGRDCAGKAGAGRALPTWNRHDRRPSVASMAERPVVLTLVEDGRVIEGNLERIGRDADWLRRELRKQGHEGCRNIFYAEWRRGTVRVYSYDQGDGKCALATKRGIACS